MKRNDEVALQILMYKIQQCQTLQNLTVFLWKQLKRIYDSGSVSPLLDFDGVCNTRNDFFQMFFCEQALSRFSQDLLVGIWCCF